MLQPHRSGLPKNVHLSHFSPTHDFPHPSGFKQDPPPDPQPRTALHLSLPPPDGKSTSGLSVLCLPSPSGIVSRLCDVVWFSGVVGSHWVHQGTFVGSLSFLTLLALSVDVVVVLHGLTRSTMC